MKKNSGLKLLTIFLTLGSLMALSGCNTIARYSEHFDFGGAISEEEEEEGSTEHEAGNHPTDEWYPITSNNYWNFRNLPNDGYAPTGSSTTYYKFYLETDLKISENFWFSQNITCSYTFCLNGHTLSTSYENNPVIWMDGGTLHICDCCANGESGGHIEGHNVTSTSGTGTGGAIHMSAGTLILDSGIISNSTALYDGGGVYVGGGQFIMNDGYIMDNAVIGAEGYDDTGGGIYVAGGGTFTMNGGTIKGNTSWDAAGVCVAQGGVANFNGGTITGNKANNDAGGVKGLANEEDPSNSATINMKGDPYIAGNTAAGTEYNVELNDYVMINLTGDLTSGASVGVTSADDKPIQITTTETNTTYYKSAYNYIFADGYAYAILEVDTGSGGYLTFDADEAGTEINNFTLYFEFYYEGENQKCPDWGEIYTEGTWDNWAGLEKLEEDVTSGVYRYYLTLDSITVGRHACQIVLEYPGQENFEHKITADGDLSFRIPSSAIESQEYTVVMDVYDSFDDILQNSGETEENVQFRINFTYNGESYKVSDWLLIYLVSDDWDYDDQQWYLPEKAIVLLEGYDEETESYYYYYNFSEIGVYSYHVQAYAHYNGEHTWNDETEYIGDFYLDVTTTDSGTSIVLNIDLEYDLEELMPDIDVDVIYNLTLTLTIQGRDLVCPDYGYFVIVSDFSYDTSTRGQYLEFPIHESEERSTYGDYQMWETDTIDAVASGNYNFDIEFRYYDDDYNTGIQTMSIFTEGTSYNYYVWNSSDQKVNCDIYNFDYNTTFVDIETTYPDYLDSNIAFVEGDHDVGVGGSLATSVTTEPEDATVTYESSDPSIAVVGEDGTIYGVSLGTTYITATARATGYYKSTDTYEVNVVSVDSFTYHISILDYNGDPLGEAPENAILYAAGDFNGTWNEGTGDGGWYDWGDEVELTWNADEETYDLEVDFIPEEGRSFEILIKDEDYGDGDYDEWNHVLGTYNIGEHDMSQIGDVEEWISVTTAIGEWSDVWEGDASDFYVALLDNSGERTAVLDSPYWVGFHAENGVWNSGDDWCEAHQLMTGEGQLAMYSDLVDAETAGDSPWFYVGINDSYMNIPQANVPVVREGYIPVYINYGWMSDIWLNNTYPDHDPNGGDNYTETSWNATTYGWMFIEEGADLATFISSLSWIG